MIFSRKKTPAVLALSGGMDSSTLLLHLLTAGYDVTALSFDYGQKHKIELEKAIQLVNYINSTSSKMDFPDIKHSIIKIDGLSELLYSTLVAGGAEVPEGHYEQENMKLTVVPNRNKIFSSILQAVALSISQKMHMTVIIALGIHAGDHAIYRDCRQEFVDADFTAFKFGNWGADYVHTYIPYISQDKFDILKDGQSCCKRLGFDFNAIYKLTNTSYKPIALPVSKKGEIHTEWFSDYKSASSVERIEAFMKLGVEDPIQYADEDGLASWDKIKNYVNTLIKK